MASQIQIRRLIPVPLIALCAAALLAVPAQPASAHQLTSARGMSVPHQHVYKRSAYGNGYVVGHIAPTRHGHDMIIWSPAPTNAYGNSVPHMHITKPSRHSRLHRQRSARSNQQFEQHDQQPRRLNRRDGR